MAQAFSIITLVSFMWLAGCDSEGGENMDGGTVVGTTGNGEVVTHKIADLSTTAE